VAEPKKPHLSIVKEPEAASRPPPDASEGPSPSPPPEPSRSENFARVKAVFSSASADVAACRRLAAFASALSRAAWELRPEMSAKSALAWAERHEQETERRLFSGDRESYPEAADLRLAALGAAEELEDAAASRGGSRHLLASVYGAAMLEYEKPEPRPQEVLAVTACGEAQVRARLGLFGLFPKFRYVEAISALRRRAGL
jgi:hypothetical protein